MASLFLSRDDEENDIVDPVEHEEMQKHLKYLNSGDPFLMVLMTHAHVESALEEMCSLVLPPDSAKEMKRAGFGRLVATARILNIVSEEERVALRKLADLRNRLAHGWRTEPDVTEEDVERLWVAFKADPMIPNPDWEELLQNQHMRLMVVLGNIGSSMRGKQRRLEKLLPEIRKGRERLNLLHYTPGVIRQLSKEDWDLFAR